MTLRQMYYGPPNWLVRKFNSEDRRAFGFWNVVVAAALTPIFGMRTMFVSILSVVALIPNFSAETPVEEEA
jgi:hypothetical protein